MTMEKKRKEDTEELSGKRLEREEEEQLKAVVMASLGDKWEREREAVTEQDACPRTKATA